MKLKIEYLFLIIFFIPLVVGIKAIDLADHELGSWLNAGSVLDLFSYYKANAIILLASFCVLHTIFSRAQREQFTLSFQQYKKIYLATFTIIFLICCSSILSPYSQTSWFGIPDRCEGGLIWISYLVLFLYAIRHTALTFTKYAQTCFQALIACQLCIGLFQFFNLDPWKNKNILYRLSFGQPFSSITKLEFIPTEFKIYGSLYHFNYFGSFLALAVPFLGVLYFRQRTLKNLFFFLIALLTTLLCGSRSGLLSIVLTLIVFIISHFKTSQLSKKNILKFALLCSCLLMISLLHSTTRNRLLSFIHWQEQFHDNTNFIARSIELTHDELRFDFQNRKFIIKNKNNDFDFYDGSNHPISQRFNQLTGQVTLNTSYGHDIQFFYLSFKGEKILAIHADKIKLGVIVHQGNFHFFDLARRQIIEKEYKQSKFELLYTFANGRGYIWSRTFPLLLEKFWMGHGADTFIYYFPVADIIGRIITYGDTHTYVDKPHSFYFQVFYNFGFIAFLLFAYIIFGSLKYNRDSIWYYSILGYLICAFFNDSVVSVAPIFWVVLGLSFHATQDRNQNQILTRSPE